jgi:predicted phage terminase large subunit-like protein
VFRRTYPQITNEGGLWDTSLDLYHGTGAEPKLSTLEWVFPNNNKIKFAHMQHELDRYQWDGAQIPMIGFDQLEHFTWKQFFYMLSRNRTTCDVPPYVRATCNPDPDHWLRTFMDWWIDPDSGLPIRERSGVIRWFVVLNDQVFWADDANDLVERFGDDATPKSYTFIAGNVYDNAILLERNPEYLSNLKALPLVDRERLLGGNWNVRESAGMFFKRGWFEIVDACPAGGNAVRYWDCAGTAEDEPNADNASSTAGVRMMVDDRGVYYVVDVIRFKGSALTVESTMKNTASQDGSVVRVGIEQEPGSSGKAVAQLYVRQLAGYDARANAVRESKGTRAKPLSAQAEARNVKLVRGSWNENYIREMVNFDGSDKCVSDQVDASSGAFLMLTTDKRAGTWGRR